MVTVYTCSEEHKKTKRYSSPQSSLLHVCFQKSHGFLDMILTIPFGLLSMPRAATLKKSFPKLGDHQRLELAMRVLTVFKVRCDSHAIVALLTFVYPAAGF